MIDERDRLLAVLIVVFLLVFGFLRTFVPQMPTVIALLIPTVLFGGGIIRTTFDYALSP